MLFVCCVWLWCLCGGLIVVLCGVVIVVVVFWLCFSCVVCWICVVMGFLFMC